jgi:hypothetical protein
MWWPLLVACAVQPAANELSLTTESGSFDVTVGFTPDPPAVGEVMMTMTIVDAEGAPVEATVAVDPWMPEHEHGVADPPVVTSTEPGVYTATWVCPMAGEWQLTIDVDDDPAVADVAFY